jgi:hypothetical protein
LTAQRLRDALDLSDTIEGLATMLSLHPMFAPRTYVAMSVEADEQMVRLGFGDCPAARENDDHTWFTGLGGTTDAALSHVVTAFHPQAQLTTASQRTGELHAYEVRIDATAEPAPEAGELSIAKISSGARFRFRG